MTQQYTLSIERSDAIRLSGYGVLLVFLGAAIFSALIGNDEVEAGHGLLMLVTYAAMLVVHELVHGFFFWLFGGKPIFGVGRVFFLLYAYASAPGTSYGLSQMLVIALSPLVLISSAALGAAAAVPALAVYMVVAFVGNFAGAVGDLWIVSRLLRFRGSENLRIVDEKTGVSVYGEGRAFEQTVAAFSAASESLLSRFVVSWMGASLVVALLTGFLTLVLVATNDQADILIGPSALPLLEYRARPAEFEVTFSLLPPIVAGFLYATIYTALQHIRSRRASPRR